MTSLKHIWWVVMLFLPVAEATAAAGDTKNISLDQLIEDALASNPEIKAARHRWQAAAERPSQVSALPDPMISYARFGESVETRVGPQENVLAISQKMPFPGKLGLKGKMANQQAIAESQAYEALRRDIVFKVKSAYYDLYWIDRSLTILDQYLALLRDFTSVAEQKYATGQGIQAHVLKSHVEISTILERRLSFEKMRQSAVARLNALLDRPQRSPLGRASAIDTSRVQLNEENLIEHALKQREELQSMQAMIDRSQYMKSLAKREYLPDFNLQANYIDISKGTSTAPDAGKNAWSVMVGLNLPIWFGKRNAAVREAEETIASNRLRYENLENEVRAEINDLYNQLDLTGRTLDLYQQGLLAQAESSLESALASYQTGRLDFLNLLDAERMLLNLNLTYVKEQANYQRQVAALERAVGGELLQ